MRTYPQTRKFLIALELISFFLHLPSSGMRFLLQKLFVFYHACISPYKGYLIVAGIVTLAGCGGGGGTTPPTTGLSGRFVITNQGTETSAGGVSYTITSASPQAAATTANVAAQSSGVTGTGGSFSYNAGDSISFSIGGQTFSLPAATKINAQDLATTVTCSGDAANIEKCRYTTAKNIETFLIGWDDDHDPSNGINFSSGAPSPTVAFTSDQFVDALATQLTAQGIAPVNTFKPSLGINTEAPQAEQDEVVQTVPFADIFRIARPFRELSSCSGGNSVTYDANGWPTSSPSASCTIRTILINNATAETLPEGRYTVLYSGEGTITYGNYAQLVSRSPSEHKDIIDIKFSGSAVHINRIDLSITVNNINNPIKNIRIVMPGGICEDRPSVRVADASGCPANKYKAFVDTLSANRNAIVFNPDYLRFMKGFRVVRMMNLMEASPRNPCTGSGATYNTCLLQDFTWNQRAQMDAATWGGSARVALLDRYGRGAPLEVQVELANQLNAHPWFNIPHNVTDDYVTNFATYVRNSLKSGLKAHIEYTNEAWNPIFWGSLYARKKGMDLGLGAGYTNQEYWAGALYYAKRATEIFQNWETVFGGNSRLVRILGTVQTDIYLTRNMLNYGDTKSHVDAVAMNAYFLACPKRSTNTTCANTSNIPKTLDEVTTLDEVFAAIDNSNDPYSLPTLRTQITNQAAETVRFSKALYVYEGGLHLTVDNTTDSTRRALFILASKDPRIGERYTSLLNAWKTAGGQQFMLYTQPQSYHTYGIFGIKETLNQARSSAPKYDAAMKFQETQGKCWWSGC